jgi:large subunit ribosomal protein L21e
MTKNARDKGKIRLSAYFASYNEGDKVALIAEPAVQNGNYNPRFHGKVGTIVSRQGECYYVAIKDGNKAKTLIVHPIHLTRCLK